MQPENIDEYKVVREEMLRLKDCMTNYVGMALAGAGAAIAAFAVLPNRNPPTLALSALALALIITLILNVLIYKFHSHNRYAAYCKLLAQEHWIRAQRTGPFYLWELLLSELRLFSIEQKKSRRQSERRRHPFKGVSLLWNALFHGARNWSTWEFPFYVVAIFFALVLLFFSASVYFAMLIGISWETGAFWVTSVILGLGIIISWAHYFGALHRLLEGEYSIEGFAAIFFSIRESLLRKYYGVTGYSLGGVEEEKVAKAHS
jgi:hypothetical protein